jgi:hypothetical protein
MLRAKSGRGSFVRIIPAADETDNEYPSFSASIYRSVLQSVSSATVLN